MQLSKTLVLPVRYSLLLPFKQGESRLVVGVEVGWGGWDGGLLFFPDFLVLRVPHLSNEDVGKECEE